MRLIARIAQWSIVAIGVAGLALVVFMAFARRDHKVELIVTYPKSPPAAVWRLLTDHASEPQWLPAFGSVVRQADIGGREVWTHTSPDGAFVFNVMTVSVVPERRYERILLREGQPRSESWDGRWIYELEPVGGGTRLRITEYGWSDGFAFYIAQRLLAEPAAFLRFYAQMVGRRLDDAPDIQILRSE